jgi:proton glutamate symport protein
MSIQPPKLSLHWQIAIALVAAVAVGAVAAPDSGLVQVCTFLGTLFLNGLKLLVVPLVITSLLSGLAGVPDARHLGRMGGLAVAWFAGTGLLAILVGLAWSILLTPGIIDGEPAGVRMGLTEDSAAVLSQIKERGSGDLLAVIQRLVPPNLFKAAADGDILGLLLFVIVFGYGLTRLPGDLGQTQRQFWVGAHEAMLGVTRFVMYFAPIGVFGLVAGVISRTGWSAIQPLMMFVATTLAGLLTHVLITLPLILLLVARVSPRRHFQAMAPAMLTAFSTSSSNATLAVSLECVQRRAGVSSRTTGFFMPIAANVNMDGSALYECAAAMFIAQAYGLELSFGTQFIIVAMALLTSIGVAGIPSASLVAIALILTTIGLPLEGLGLILAVDRILDMCRTAVNVFGDSSGAVTIARLTGEKDVLSKAVA